MAKFKDSKDREWAIELDTPTADEVKELLGVDLIDPESLDQTFLKLNTDSRTVVNLAWALVKPQADEKQVTEADFKRSLKTEQVRVARVAITEAIADFSPSPEMAQAMRDLFRAASERLPGLITQGTNESLAQLSASSVGNLPASSDGTA